MRDVAPGTRVGKSQGLSKILENIRSDVRTSNPGFEKADALIIGLTTLQLTLLGLLASWVRKHPVSIQDLTVTRALQKKDSRFLYSSALAFSYSSSPKIMMPITVPLTFILWKMHLRLAAVVFTVLSTVNEITKLVIKHIVGRPRPNPALVHVYKGADGQSFPSGNVASSVTFWGWLLAMGLLHWKGRVQKMVLAIPAVIMILVSPSRVYLGDHWPSDVLGGYLLGGSWLALALRAYLKLRRTDDRV